MVFIIDLVFGICALLHAFIFVLGKQKRVQTEQLQVGIIEAKDESEQFPICLQQAKNEPIVENKWYYIPTLNCYESIMLICILLCSAMALVFIIHYILSKI